MPIQINPYRVPQKMKAIIGIKTKKKLPLDKIKPLFIISGAKMMKMNKQSRLTDIAKYPFCRNRKREVNIKAITKPGLKSDEKKPNICNGIAIRTINEMNKTIPQKQRYSHNS